MKYVNTASKFLPAGSSLELPRSRSRWPHTDKMVGEGQILFIVPRHPSKGVQNKEHIRWKEALGDIEVDLETGEWGVSHTLEAIDWLTGWLSVAASAVIVQLAAQPPN